tara:strand:- start:1559 stop:1810 length:252 start_codon:yes stop_codon:yes gene_type:complete
MSESENKYKIELTDKKITPAIYGHLVNCIGLKATISHVGEIKGNTVEIGVESMSSGWTAASLNKSLSEYPPLEDYNIQVSDVE